MLTHGIPPAAGDPKVHRLAGNWITSAVRALYPASNRESCAPISGPSFRSVFLRFLLLLLYYSFSCYVKIYFRNSLSFSVTFSVSFRMYIYILLYILHFSFVLRFRAVLAGRREGGARYDATIRWYSCVCRGEETAACIEGDLGVILEDFWGNLGAFWRCGGGSIGHLFGAGRLPENVRHPPCMACAAVVSGSDSGFPQKSELRRGAVFPCFSGPGLPLPAALHGLAGSLDLAGIAPLLVSPDFPSLSPSPSPLLPASLPPAVSLLPLLSAPPALAASSQLPARPHFPAAPASSLLHL